MKGHFWILTWVLPRQEAAQEEKSSGFIQFYSKLCNWMVFSDEQMTIVHTKWRAKGRKQMGVQLCVISHQNIYHTKIFIETTLIFFRNGVVFCAKHYPFYAWFLRNGVCVRVCVCVYFVWYVSEKVKPFFPTTNAAFYTAHRICHFFVSDLMFFSCVFGRFREKKHPGSQ